MAELWEFIENPQPSGDGVSLIPQDWAPVENVLRPTEIVLLLAGLQTRGNISAVWRLISANRQDMLVYQSYMAPFPKLVFRPRTERSILLKAYASLTPTTVRFQMKYATTDNVALDLELPVHGGISMYDLLSAVQDGLTPPPGVGVQLLSTAHVQRPLTIFDCMVFMDEWTFQELEAKILAVGEVLMQQQTDLVEKSFKSVKATQLKQVLEDISGFVTLTAEQATRIGTILRRGPWDQEDRAIAAACLSNVLANTGRKGGAVVRRANQDLLSFHKFLSKNDACVLADPSASMHTNADVVASRMVKIQLWLASEQAYSEVIKTVQAAGAEMSSAQDQYAFLQLLKKMVRSRVKKLPKNIELPNPFPDKPEDLPDHVRAEAYNPEDPAVTIEGSVAKGSIMRKSSSELRPQDVQVALPSKKPRTSFSSNQPSQQEMFAGMASQFASFMMNYMNGNPSGSSGSNATDLQHGAHGQASQESSPPPQPQQSLATLRPELQSPTQQAPSQVQVTDANMGFTQFEMPDTSRPELEEREPDRQPLSAAAAALAVEKAVENRNEKTKPGILKKPAAAETAAPKAKAKATAKVKAKSTPKAKAKSQSKKTTINQGPNKGWVVEVRERRVGNSAGQTDTYYRPTRNIQGHFETEARREDVSYIDPLAVLWHACNQGGGFQEFLQNCVLYFSLKQFGGLALSKEDSWFVLTAVRSTDVKRLSNGMTQLMKRHSFLSACQWPAAVGDKGASAKKVFAKKVTEFKSSASEAMALYPVMRAFLQEKLPSIRDNQCKECCRCFFVLCEVLDLLCKTSVPLDPSTLAAALEQKIETHMELFKRCYGVEKVIPKAHFNLHLGDLLRRHGLLLSCFVHERRHKEIKRYANNLDSMQAGSERHILQLELEEHMKNLLVFSEMKAGLVNPKAAAGQVQQAFCDYFSLPGSPGLLVSMSCHVGNGRLCKREDVVVVHGPNGDEVAQVWFHVEFNGHGYTCMSEWRSLGRNRFRTCDEPVFRSTHAICRLCAFKKETDRALVIPLSMPM
ncbi:unnamed protein product [Symbiodinium sp. CCMP2592]|nr:unnamed protein product [Symbiodinium sp. CCMP2592]